MGIACQKRQRKKGTVYRYVVTVRRQHFKAIESLTFPDKASGNAWAKAVEKDMLEQAKKAEESDHKYESAKSRTGDIQLKDYLERYRAKQEKLSEDQRISHRDMLAIKFWEKSWLAKLRSNEITDAHLIKLLDERLDTVTPSTNHLYVSVLRRAIDWQKRLGLYFSRFITEDVMKELWKLKLVGKSKEDDTRPTEEQVYQLYQCFLEGYNTPLGTVPYHHLMLFSIYSSFREGEICRIRYSDLDIENGMVVIRERKDPKKKYSNHQKVPICPICLEIIAMQPRIEGEDRIFPYRAHSVSSRFSTKTKEFGYPELRFHSFRHDGISRFFEQGMSIPEVALRSGHKTWDNLRRYTHLVHKQPPDLWGKCKAMEEQYWAENEVVISRRGRGLKKRG
ncbi:tyrosine-type recombinase/integrase [Endozoicomonas euniceicola]|uniref:Tyrosine-type recombinase/integrase n=1 Tax=Endozoicomonas euniceicola TaxID=1234143 RepID=A0ABY6GVZ7_9GAMM|nr:tyrosine-type recombinase/integrase [Endozoicomonas euniceicola]UYM16228.1 tyrosine-type recombinase/integrase [Endozoicomonas euniceicola]